MTTMEKKGKVTRADSNGTKDEVADVEEPSPSLFARRLTRLEQVSIQLRHLRRDYSNCLIAEKQHKANIYLNADARSHGEREGMASAHSVSLSTETLLLKGQIDALEEERDFLKFCIEWDVEE